MRNFDINLLEKGDIIHKKDGSSFEVVDIETCVSFKDRLEIHKNIKMRELVKFTEIKLDVDIKS